MPPPRFAIQLDPALRAEWNRKLADARSTAAAVAQGLDDPDQLARDVRRALWLRSAWPYLVIGAVLVAFLVAAALARGASR